MAKKPIEEDFDADDIRDEEFDDIDDFELNPPKRRVRDDDFDDFDDFLDDDDWRDFDDVFFDDEDW